MAGSADVPSAEGAHLPSIEVIFSRFALSADETSALPANT